MNTKQPHIETLQMTIGVAMAEEDSPKNIEIPLEIKLPNGRTMYPACVLGGLPFHGQQQIAERIAAAWNAFTGIATTEIHAHAPGAGGVEPLRKRECLHSISEPEAQPVGVAPEWWRKRADEIETDVARGGSIAAMNCYTKMRQLHQAATSPQPAVQSLDAREFPAMTPELAAILGTMCFETINLAKILRSAGQDIKTRAEDEQAAVLHWMLSLWFKHGEGWRQAAAQEVMGIKDAAIAAQPGGA